MDCTGTLEEFIATGRTGRRNAMPDILDEQKAAVGTGGLAFDMKKMNCSGIMLILTGQERGPKNIQRHFMFKHILFKIQRLLRQLL